MAAAWPCDCLWRSAFPATRCACTAWFAELDRFADVPFMEDGRRQPPMPPATTLFE